jgi:Tfp pilus assembly protein PilE
MGFTLVPRLRHRFRHEERGFMLIELFIVFMILAILLTVGVAAYIGFRERAADAAAEANLRAIIPTIEAYYADRRTYEDMTLDVLEASYDQAIEPSRYSLSGVTTATYCISSTYAGQTWRKAGPEGAMGRGATC